MIIQKRSLYCQKSVILVTQKTLQMKKVFILAISFCIITSFQKKPISWVAIGDSITYLNEHPDETGNRITKGYMTGVVEKLPHVRYTNQGHNGWTSGGIANAI